MMRTKKIFIITFAAVFTMFTLLCSMPSRAAEKKVLVPEVQFVSAPITEYTVGDRVRFDISSPSYGGKVEYRVVLWNNSTKSYSDLWNEKNGYPGRYYTKWQPNGNTVFTLGWPIIEPGTYRITVYAKRVGVAPSNAALKGMNCDSYKQSVAFTVKPKVSLPVEEDQTNDSTINTNVAAIKVKDGEEYRTKVDFINEQSMYAIIEYPTTLGELKESIESTNGSTQTYYITSSNNIPKGDNEILKDEDILTVTSQDKTATAVYTIYVFDTMTFAVTNGTTPIEGAVINIYYDGELEYFINSSGDTIFDLVTDGEGQHVFNLSNAKEYTYTITATGYETKQGSFATGQLDSDTIEARLLPAQINSTDIKGKDGDKFREIAQLYFSYKGLDQITIEYPATVGEVKGAIESANGSVQTYSITNSDNIPKEDSELVSEGDKLIVISQDRTETTIHTMELVDTMIFTVTNGTTPIEGAVINLNYKGEFECSIIDLITDGEGKWKIDVPCYGEFTYTIAADGYETKYGSFTPGQPNSDALTIVLLPSN